MGALGSPVVVRCSARGTRKEVCEETLPCSLETSVSALGERHELNTGCAFQKGDAHKCPKLPACLPLREQPLVA